VPAGTPQGTYDVGVTVTNGGRSQTLKVPVEADLRNLSFGKPSTQKSVAWNGAARLAVDGNVDGVFFNGSVTHTAEPRPRPGGRSGRPSQVQLPRGTSGRHVRIQLASPSSPLSLA